MTTTPPPDGQPDAGPAGATQVDDGPRVTREEVRDLARLRRTTGPQRTVAGVAGGVGRHLDIDPVILRVAFVVLAFFGGAGILLYGAAWLLVPDDAALRPPLGLDERSRTVALWIATGLGAAVLLGTSFGDGFVPFPVVVVAAIALVVVLQVNKRKAAEPPPVDLASGHPPYAAAPAAGWVGAAVTLEKRGAEQHPAPAPPFVPGPPAPRAGSWTVPVPRVNPRKRGSILFWFTAALCALGLGLLGVLDLAGSPIAGPAYPALVVGVVGAMLVLGAFWGRAGGLVLVGLIATVVLVGSIAAQEIDGETLRPRPTTAAEVAPTYTIGTGELVLDLRGVTDPQALAGRTITLGGDIGHLEVIVPDGLAVDARAHVDGPGGWTLFGSQGGGIGQSGFASAAGGTDPLVIDAHLEVGAIEISTSGSS